MDALFTDLRLALRTLVRRPGFTVFILLTIAVGIGATTALFGVFKAAFLDPLPFPNSGQLVAVLETFDANHRCCSPATGPDYLEWRRQSRAFSELAAVDPSTFTLTGLGEAQRVDGAWVTASAFRLLGVRPMLGRPITAADQTHPGAVVLSYGFWQTRFGGSRAVLGRSFDLNGKSYTVVGVMPKGFDVPTPWSRLGQDQFYIPFPDDYLPRWRGSSLPVIARLAPGVTVATAQADMDRVMRDRHLADSSVVARRGVRVFTLHQYMYGGVGRELGIVLGAGLLVLLVACGNIAGLVVSRAAARETELAVRAALGAGRPAILRMLFAETIVLTAAGGALGAGVSFVALGGLKALLPPTIPRIADAHIDATALVFTLGATLLTAAVAGLVPAALAARRDLAGSVKVAGYGTRPPASERLRQGFIVAQMALGLVMANSAAVLVRSYWALQEQSFGFDASHVLTMALNPAGPGYRTARGYAGFYDRVLTRVRALPGVESVGTASCLPLSCGGGGNVWVEGQSPPTASNPGPFVDFTSVSGSYFTTMHIPLLQGRLLLPRDSASAAVGVVINEAFAKQAWPGEDPLGKRFSYPGSPPDWLTVVGVVEDAKENGAEARVLPQAYAPLVQGWTMGADLAVRTAGDPAALIPAVRRAILAVDPAQPPSDVRTMRERVDATFAQRRFYTTLIGLFALAALLLAAAGVYGTASYSVTQRKRELGIRAALGAGEWRLIGFVLWRGARAAFWGMVVGLAGIWGSTRVLSGLLFGVHVVSLPMLGAGCAALITLALMASAAPALRAARTPPASALAS